MPIRRNDITIDTGDLDKLYRAFKQYPPLILKTFPPALRKESQSFIRDVRSGVKINNWANFCQPVSTGQIPRKFQEVGIRVKPRNNIAYVFEFGFKNRQNKVIPRPVYTPAFDRFSRRTNTDVKNNLIREGKAQMMKALTKNGIRY